MVDPTEVAGRLRSLAAKLDIENCARLDDLADSLTGEGETESWDRVDLFQILDPEEIAFAGSGYRWRLIIEVARNTVVLLPVIVTWFAISRAAAAFHALVASGDPVAQQPFLSLWEAGFAGRLAGPTLDQVALLDSVLVAIVLGLTVLAHLFRAREEARRKELTAALRSTALCLARRPPPSPEIVAARLSSAIDAWIRQAARMGQDRAQEIERLSATRATAETMLSLITLVAERLPTLVDALTKLSQAAGQLPNEGTAIREELQLGRAAMTQLLEAIVALRQDEDDTRATLAAAGTRLGQVAGDLAGKQAALLAALADERAAQFQVNTVVTRALTSLRQALHGIDNYAETFHLLAVDLRALRRLLPTVAPQVDEILTIHARAVHELERLVELTENHISSVPERNGHGKSTSNLIADGKDGATPVARSGE